MPRTSPSYLPKYRATPGRDCARVTLCGKIYYLGKYGSEASHRKYDQLIREGLDQGRQMHDDSGDLSIAELVEAYVEFARTYYGGIGNAM